MRSGQSMVVEIGDVLAEFSLCGSARALMVLYSGHQMWLREHGENDAAMKQSSRGAESSQFPDVDTNV